MTAAGSRVCIILGGKQKKMRWFNRSLILAAGMFLLIAATTLGIRSYSQQQQSAAERTERFKRMSADAEKKGLSGPYLGITTDGKAINGLFPIRSTGVSTGPVRKAADAFLASLSPAQRSKTMFDVNDDEWRKWMNQHFYLRQGTGFNEMSDAQRDAAFGLMRASLSARGLKLTRDIMHLNETLAELNNNDHEQYGEWLYWITIMGKPSATEPWGWQLDGHHAIINYFVLGDQVVMSPTFLGSEPVIARSGKYQGTAVLQTELKKGLAMINALSDEQRKKAILTLSKTANNNVGEAFKDNMVLDYQGIPGSELNAKQKEQLLDLAAEYVGNMDNGHAKVKMSEVRKHVNATWFSWIGGIQPDSVFYYRIQSPVILIEFDQQLPVGTRHLKKGPIVPDPEHIHTVMRTPNGNDYGKDLLRQHYLEHPHPQSH